MLKGLAVMGLALVLSMPALAQQGGTSGTGKSQAGSKTSSSKVKPKQTVPTRAATRPAPAARTAGDDNKVRIRVNRDF